ncbi:MAG TPA: ABC transporter permease subunit [Mycobacteriales bacterium]|nr:ABC transporter permease subunit [Mycobacteriales bacterium]
MTQTAEFDPRTSLPLRVELVRQLRRRRTTLTLGFLVLLPFILVGAFALSSGSSNDTYVDLAKSGAVNFTMFTLFASVGFLLVVVVALFFGDTIASEASWGSLRYLLAMPVPRTRLLRQKLIVAAGYSFAGIVLLPTVALLLGAAVYGWNPVRTPAGDTYSAWTGVARLALVVGYIAVTLLLVAGTAFWLSTVTDAPLGAVGGAVGIVIVSNILDSITALHGWRTILPTHYQFSWTDALAVPATYTAMAKGCVASLIYSGVFFTAAFRHFSRKDILS